jgi:hypothetical protein
MELYESHFTVFYLRGERYDTSYTGYTYVAYCFAPVDGYSSFGSYTGNGSADGPFVYTGFRPGGSFKAALPLLMDWYLFDTGVMATTQERALYPNDSQMQEPAFYGY